MAPTIQMLNQNFSEIDKIRMSYLFNEEESGAAGTQSTSSFSNRATMINTGEEEEKSVFSGIKDIFTSFSVKGGIAAGFNSGDGQKHELTKE